MSDRDAATDRADETSVSESDGGDESGAEQRVRDDAGVVRSEGDDEWKFTVASLEESEAPEREPIEPGDPALENAVFVVLGVLGTIGLLATAIPGVL